MSVIAVKILKDEIVIAGDSQYTQGYHKFNTEEKGDRQMKVIGKLFQVNGMTIGCAGTVHHISLLRIFCKTHKPKSSEKDAIIDWVIEFKDYACTKLKISYSEVNVDGIIIMDGIAFMFHDWVDANLITDFDAVGSGAWLSIGAMEVGASPEDAVKVACKYDNNCGGEITQIVIKK